MQSVNPVNGEVIRDYPEHTPREVEALVMLAAERYASWRRTTFAHRSELMSGAAAVLREERGSLAELMTAEMGK